MTLPPNAAERPAAAAARTSTAEAIAVAGTDPADPATPRHVQGYIRLRIITLQYSSTNLYRVSYHTSIQSLLCKVTIGYNPRHVQAVPADL